MIARALKFGGCTAVAARQACHAADVQQQICLIDSVGFRGLVVHHLRVGSVWLADGGEVDECGLAS
jgi:hypothetical protein